MSKIEDIALAINQSQTTAFASHKDRINQNQDSYIADADEIVSALRDLSKVATGEAQALLEREQAVHASFLKTLKEEVIQMMDGSNGFKGFMQMVAAVQAESESFESFIEEEKQAIRDALEKVETQIGMDFSFSESSK
tara:strand:+ start:175 stop:588 length:414 start_codon:yes stop_codon:yes gene_type:complete